MRITLPSNLDRYVADQVDCGRFNNADQMIAVALEAMQRLDALRGDVQVGVDQLDRGESLSVDNPEQLAAFADRIKSRGREHFEQSK